MGRSHVRYRQPLALTSLLFICAGAMLLQKTKPAAAQDMDMDRVAEIAALLGREPAGFGTPIDNRDRWTELSRHDSFAGEISDAERLLDEPIPEQSDDLYLDFSRTGNRTRWQRVSGRRRRRIPTLVVAECLENKGRFLPAFDEIVEVLCSERTWVMPAHDAKLTNFHGESIDIDLGSSALAWSLATADYLLADKLSPETRRLIRENLERRIFQPYRDMVLGQRQKNWWMTGTNNWNAVCLANVTGSAMAVIDSRDERAFFAAAAEYYSKSFLEGFTDDGYCSEGLGYWNYGFGYYVMLCETIHQATGGKVDLLADGKAKQAATFGSRIEIISEVYPAFADCSIRAEPSSRLMYYLSRRLGLGLRRWERIDPVSAGSSLYQSMMYSFDNSATATPPAESASEGPGLRSWFDQAGVLICRSGSDSSSRFAVALKGGHNNEHHNHNDVGSFVVVLGNRPLLIDPGGEVYTARTFSGRRYESNVLNSFGHPVPLVAGKLQETGRQARARLVRHAFGADTDAVVFDIASAYDVPELKKLERTFVYCRDGSGSLSVTDEVVFSQPCDFGTALITFDQWRQASASSLVVSDGEKALRVDITAEGAGFQIQPETIKEDLSARREPVRLGINLTKPVTSAVVRLTIKPQG
ncbi:MAG: heparinase II/III family protein [Phycisphaerales bacterium]|nr:MAG: heparinase II/III family protein [Phycisphaerales bacterium]